MTRFTFIHGVLFSLYLISYQCEGGITSPPKGKEYLVLSGETVKIKWEFDDAVSSLKFRSWTFTSNGSEAVDLASIFKDGPTDIETTLFEVDIERPATLVLRNVNQSYNGKYDFVYTASTSYKSDVIVSVPKKPTAIVNCPSRNEINEGGDFTCECRSEGGIPENNATWFKNGVQIGETRKENIALTLTDVNATDGGTYKCVSQSYFDEAYKDEKSIELIVRLNSQPNNTSIRFTPNPATVGNQVEIRCDSEGVPEPSFIIMRNGKHISTEKTYTISKVKQSHEGPYTCIAVNILGNDSATDNLTVIEQGRTTTSPPATSTTKTASTTMKDKTFSNEINCGTEWYIVVVSLVSGVIIGIIFSYFVWCCHRRWFRNRKPKRNPEAQTNDVDTTYQELDRTKMNKEDNYQSLRMNAASNDAANDDDATYTKLSKSRDVEDNYQSLT